MKNTLKNWLESIPIVAIPFIVFIPVFILMSSIDIMVNEREQNQPVEEFKKIKTETFIITDKIKIEKAIPGTLRTSAVGRITIIKEKEAYYLTVPLEEYPFLYAGLEITLQMGEDESIVLSEDGKSRYTLEKIEQS